VPRNEEYAILKEFAVFEDTPNCREYTQCQLDDVMRRGC
jgi:hypothetical protein